MASNTISTSQVVVSTNVLGVSAVISSHAVSSPPPPPPPPRSLLMELSLSGPATMAACLFSNPFEVVKTRMQVQNELAARGSAPILYRNAMQAFVDIGRKEGIRGLQGGLAPALLYQFAMNGTRLALYEPLKRSIRSVCDGGAGVTSGSGPVLWQSVLAAGVSGAFAAFIATPFFLVKVRLQVQAKQGHAQIAPGGASASPSVVGAQHNYTSALGGLRSIYRADGITGMFRGGAASMIRVTTGSVVQLSTYDTAKHQVKQRTGWEEGVKLHFSSSLLSGFLGAVAMNPSDVISTRLSNQPVVNGRGQLYDSWLDCAKKTIQAEGIRGYYKGFVAHYLRLGPHTILTFIFWEQLKAIATKAGV